MLRFIIYTYIPVIITDPYTHSHSEHSLQKGLWGFDIETCYVGFYECASPSSGGTMNYNHKQRGGNVLSPVSDLCTLNKILKRMNETPLFILIPSLNFLCVIGTFVCVRLTSVRLQKKVLNCETAGSESLQTDAEHLPRNVTPEISTVSKIHLQYQSD